MHMYLLLYVSLVAQPKPSDSAVAQAVRCRHLTRMPGFSLWAVHVGYVVDKVSLGHVYPSSTSVFSLPIVISPLLDAHLITASEGCGMYIHNHVLCKRHRKVYLNNQGCTKPPIFSSLTSPTSRLMQ